MDIPDWLVSHITAYSVHYRNDTNTLQEEMANQIGACLNSNNLH